MAHVGDVYVKDNLKIDVIPKLRAALAKTDLADMRTASQALVTELQTSVGATPSTPTAIITTPPSTVDEAKVYNRFKDIFNGQEGGLDFKAIFEAISNDYLGPTDKGLWDTWMGEYLKDETPTVGLFTGESADAYIVGAYFGADGPSADFKEYTQIRYELVNTVKTGAGTMDFDNFKKWLELRAKTVEVGDFFTTRIGPTIPKITEKLTSYFPAAADVHDFTTWDNVVVALKDIFAKHSETGALFAGDDAKMGRRIEQIIGALYLENNASAEAIWNAFHHTDMGNDDAEIGAWLDAGTNLFGAGHADGKPTQPDVPANGGGYDGTHIFGHEEAPTGAAYLAALHDGPKATFITFLEGPDDPADAASGAGSRLAMIGHGGAKYATNDNKRKGFDVFARGILSQRIQAHRAVDAGTRILNRFIKKFLLDQTNTLDDKKDAMEAFFTSVDSSRDAYNDPDNHFGGAFNADPASVAETQKRFFCLPIKSERYDANPALQETLDKLYEGKEVDPSDFPKIARDTIATQRVAMEKALIDFAIGDNAATRTGYTAIDAADLTEAKFY